MKNRGLFFILLAVVCSFVLNGCSSTPGDSELNAQFKPLIAANLGLNQIGLGKPLFEVVKLTKTNGRKVSETDYLVDSDVQIKFLYDYAAVKEKLIEKNRTSWMDPNEQLSRQLGFLNEKVNGAWVNAGETHIVKFHDTHFSKTEKGWIIAQ